MAFNTWYKTALSVVQQLFSIGWSQFWNIYIPQLTLWGSNRYILVLRTRMLVGRLQQKGLLITIQSI